MSYQMDLEYIDTIKEKDKKKEVYKSKWDAKSFKDVMLKLYQLDKQDRKRRYSGWFMYLEDLKVSGTTSLSGRFRYAEYGYKGKWVHADSMEERDNDKSLREGEEQYVYFYFRLSDGLLLLQGDMKVTRSKVEDYISNIGKEKLKNSGYDNIAIRTLLREDFHKEIEKLDLVKLIEVEIQTEKTSSYENEAVIEAKRQAAEVEANYASVILRSKYRQQGLKNIGQYLEGFKPRGSKTVASGVKNIKVIGDQNGELRRVYLDKIAEKYTRDLETDENKQLKKERVHTALNGIGEMREKIWRE